MWKQEINLGKKTNQDLFSFRTQDRSQRSSTTPNLSGSMSSLIEESHTSKVSFLDFESLEHQEKNTGKRVRRGLFVASNGRRMQADVNGSYNIIRKVAPCAFTAAGVEGAVVRPVRISLTNYKTPVLGMSIVVHKTVNYLEFNFSQWPIRVADLDHGRAEDVMGRIVWKGSRDPYSQMVTTWER